MTAAAGFAVGIALVVGSMSSPATSSATPSATLYDSWGSSAWPFDQPSDREESEQTPREARTNTDANGEPEVLAGTEMTEDDTIVVTGEEPIAVSIPAMGAAAEVIPVGLDEGGGVFVPEDVRTLGWYTASMPVAADRGSSVIVGHRDSAVQGAGTFSGIENLQPGEVVEVTTADGGTQVYTVTEILMVDKDEFATIAAGGRASPDAHHLRRRLRRSGPQLRVQRLRHRDTGHGLTTACTPARSPAPSAVRRVTVGCMTLSGISACPSP